MADGELWDPCGGKSSGPESRAANELNRKNRPGQRGRVLAAIRSAGRFGLACFEVEEILGDTRSGVSARFADLKRDHLIVASTERRKTRAGGVARVYIAAEFFADRLAGVSGPVNDTDAHRLESDQVPPDRPAESTQAPVLTPGALADARAKPRPKPPMLFDPGNFDAFQR